MVLSQGKALFQRLLDTKANPNIADSTGRTALDIAVRNFGHGIIDMLLTAGAAPLQSSLLIAIKQSRTDVIELLLEHKVPEYLMSHLPKQTIDTWCPNPTS